VASDTVTSFAVAADVKEKSSSYSTVDDVFELVGADVGLCVDVEFALVADVGP
jgi:hypothetical protein